MLTFNYLVKIIEEWEMSEDEVNFNYEEKTAYWPEFSVLLDAKDSRYLRVYLDNKPVLAHKGIRPLEKLYYVGRYLVKSYNLPSELVN